MWWEDTKNKSRCRDGEKFAIGTESAWCQNTCTNNVPFPRYPYAQPSVHVARLCPTPASKYHLELSGTSGASREVPGALEEFPFTTLTDGDLLIFPDSPRLTCKFYRGTSCRAVMPILRWSRQSCVKRPEYTVALRFT